jgi:hypothetical protein
VASVEASVHGLLDASAGRSEQRCHRKGGSGNDQAGVMPAEQLAKATD